MQIEVKPLTSWLSVFATVAIILRCSDLPALAGNNAIVEDLSARHTGWVSHGSFDTFFGESAPTSTQADNCLKMCRDILEGKLTGKSDLPCAFGSGPDAGLHFSRIDFRKQSAAQLQGMIVWEPGTPESSEAMFWISAKAAADRRFGSPSCFLCGSNEDLHKDEVPFITQDGSGGVTFEPLWVCTLCLETNDHYKNNSLIWFIDENNCVQWKTRPPKGCKCSQHKCVCNFSDCQSRGYGN